MLQQDKDKPQRIAEMEITWFKEELCQQKDQDNRFQGQANRRLKEEIEDFEKLYWKHKELEKEYDQKRDKIKEARMQVKDKTEALAVQERPLAEITTKLLEDIVREQLELLIEQNQIIEHS